jgi:hypothetical protein
VKKLTRFLKSKFSKSDHYVTVVKDLDALISDSVAFKWGGKIHEIRPIETGEFLQVYEALGMIDALRKQDKITPTEILDAQYKLFSSLCSTIERSDLDKMTYLQVGDLYQLFIDTISGKSQVLGNPLEKKTLAEVRMLYENAV